MPFEIYVHIPFCVKKCDYCDFLSFPAGREQQRLYADALLREIRHAAGAFMKGPCCREKADGFDGRASGISAELRAEISQPEVSSIFIGGGTPSLLPAEWITEILQELRDGFRVRKDAETTVEANPGTADAEKLQAYRAAGINRISFGCQSFHDEELKILGRIHSVSDIRQSVRLAREAGFANINLDLMSGLPGQTLPQWEETLRQAIALNPEHISAYSLIIEEGTPFRERYGRDEEVYGSDGVLAESGSFRPLLPDEGTERRMYERTAEILSEAGFRQYEISNYAKEGYACRHNLGYWTGVPYLGFGLGASGYLPRTWFDRMREAYVVNLLEKEKDQAEKNTESLSEPELQKQTIMESSKGKDRKHWIRYRNTCDLAEYTAGIGTYDELQDLDSKDLQAEFMILGLRLTEGVEEAAFEERFGQTADSVYGSVISKYTKMGLMVRENGRICLSREGISVSNRILADFL